MVSGLLEREEIWRSQEEIDPYPGVDPNLKLFYGHETIPLLRGKRNKISVCQSHGLTSASLGGPIHDLALWISLPDD